MMFRVLALDYDGTIARDGVLDPYVRTAIAEMRARGIVVLLVTGRILDDLRHLTGGLHFVDAVVAENGAVLAFPDSGYTTTLAPPPPPILASTLRAEGVAIDTGRVVVEADAADGERILQAIRRLELPLTLSFNRGRLMVLPQAISKATGLRHALTILRLSPHNTVAIGDAENDHALLDVSELGAAVAWGSPRLQEAADAVIAGDGPPAVADYVRSLAAGQRLPAPPRARRRLLVGHAIDGEPMALAVRGRNVLVAGETKSGKSWVAGLLCEQLILLGYCVCVLDPEGDYVSLESLPGVRVLGGADPLPRPRELLRALRHPDVSLVIDLSHVSYEAKRDYMRTVLPALTTLRRHTGLPHRILVDEAHYFLHDDDVLSLIDLELSGYTLVTYRASRLHPAILEASEAILVTRESDPREIAALVGRCGPGHGSRADEWRQLFESLVVGEAVALPVTEEAEGTARRVRLAPRLTPHVRHLAKYIDIPVPYGRAFVFSHDGAPAGPRATTLREFVGVIEHQPPPVLDGHLRRHDFSRWVAEVFGDYPLARDLQRLEREYASGAAEDVAGRLSDAVRSRYEFLEPVPPGNADPAAAPLT